MWCAEATQECVRSDEMVSSTVVWLMCGPALTATFIGLLVAFLLEQDDPVLYFSLMGAAILALLLRMRLSRPGARARLLSGNSPFGCFNAPRTPEDFVDRLCEVWSATGKRPTVVGSGWGFFIGRVSASNAVFTHRMKGRTGEFTFLAGTELRTAEAAIRKSHSRTFWSTPTMQRISIGSWLARSCHGNSGPKGKPSSFAALEVRVVNLESLAKARAGMKWFTYDTIKHEFDRFPGRFVIAEVMFSPDKMPFDFLLQKRRCDIEEVYNEERSVGLREWLTDEAVLRVVFFGSARKMAIGVTYVKFDPDHTDDEYSYRREFECCGKMVKHRDPHGCSASLMSLQLDTCSLVCGCYEKSKRAWRGVTFLSAANAFSPDPSWLGFPIVALLSGTVNFEMIFVLPQLVAPTQKTQELRVQNLCNALFTVFKKVWGRSELRMGDLDKGLIFVDCVMRPRDASVMISAVAPHIHSGAVALHDSKFQGAPITDAFIEAGLARKTPRVVFGMVY